MSRDTAHPGPTCWVTRPLLRIDYAFLSPALAAGPEGGGGPPPAAAPVRPPSPPGPAAKAGARVRGYQRMEDDASDHFAVVVDLELPAPSAAGGQEPEANN